jgi:hypothetical protein
MSVANAAQNQHISHHTPELRRFHTTQSAVPQEVAVQHMGLVEVWALVKADSTAIVP